MVRYDKAFNGLDAYGFVLRPITQLVQNSLQRRTGLPERITVFYEYELDGRTRRSLLVFLFR